MSNSHDNSGSDMGAAFTGLLGGAVLIGAVLYGIVLLTNAKFDAEKAEKGEKKTGSVHVQAPVLRSVQA